MARTPSVKPCFECGSQAHHMHHVVPKSRGGTMTVPLCVLCHGKCHRRRMTTPALTKAALAAMRKAGRLTGAVPFGWSVDCDGNLQPIAGEQRTIELIATWRVSGWSLQAIADRLNEANVATKREGSKWYASTVRSIMLRKSALGATDGR